MNDPQFDSVSQALRFAYSHIDRNMLKISSPQRGINCTNKSDLSPLEMLAEAVLILSTLKELPHVQSNVIKLHYSNDRLDVIAKQMGHIAHSSTGYVYGFCMNVCFDWANNGNMRKNYKYWEKEEDLDRTTIWRRANKIKKEVLDMYEEQAVRQLRTIMQERGIIA